MPALAGEPLRIPLSPLTGERRQGLTRIVRAEGEEAKVAIRNLRRDANDQSRRMLRDKDISEDADRRFQDEIQRLTDKYVAEVDKIGRASCRDRGERTAGAVAAEAKRR